MSVFGLGRTSAAPAPPTRDSGEAARAAMEERQRRARAVGLSDTIMAGRSFLGGGLGGNPSSAGPAGSVATPTLGGRSYLGG